MASAAWINSPVRAATFAPKFSPKTERVVRQGESVKLPAGHYDRVILDGGRLIAPGDVTIGELVFHAGSLAMPARS
jgi:hypothetical protein